MKTLLSQGFICLLTFVFFNTVLATENSSDAEEATKELFVYTFQAEDADAIKNYISDGVFAPLILRCASYSAEITEQMPSLKSSCDMALASFPVPSEDPQAQSKERIDKYSKVMEENASLVTTVSEDGATVKMVGVSCTPGADVLELEKYSCKLHALDQ